jgi:chromosome segregation ATPase
MNKTVKNAQPRSTTPRPVSRSLFQSSKHLQDIASRDNPNPLQSIFPNANRSQSRNNRLLTNVGEIKDNCKSLHTQLRRMQRESEAQCEELYEKLKKIDSKEIDNLKVLLKKCNDEKEEQDKIIKKLNKELEGCKREKEEKDKIITNHESIYLELLAKYDNQKKTIQKMATNYEDLKDVYDKLNFEKYISEQSIFSDKSGKSKVEPLDLYDPSELNKYTPSELKELLISTRRAKQHAFGKSGVMYNSQGSVLYNKSRPLPSELREKNISLRRKNKT